MIKYEEPFADILEMFEKVILGSGLDKYGVNVKLLVNNKQKELTKVIKLSELTTHLTSEHIVITYNQSIFEQLTEGQQKMVIDEALAQIYYDAEKDKLIMVKPDLTTYSLLLQKYGYEQYVILKESVKTLIAKKEEENAPNGK